MAGRLRARGVAIVLAAGAAVVGLLGGVAVTPAAAQPTVLTVPTVTGVSPTSGPVIGGTVVTITGNFFTSPVTVNFGANASTNVTLVNSTTLKATSPPVTATAKVDITVTTAGGTSLTSAADQFTYTGPTVTGVSPASGPAAGGTVVTIFGTGFTTGSTVTFGGTAAAATFVSATVLKATSPAGTGAVDVQVTTAPYTSKANPPLDTFTYNAGPTVTSVTPSSGPTAGGTVVTITGTGFTTGSTVAFGANAGTNVTFVNSTTLKATSPAGTGTVDVRVTTGTNTSPINTVDKFTYGSPQVTVTSVSPASGPTGGGTVVTISGTGFTNASTVAFGANAGTNVTFLSATALKATSPAGAAGKVDITVTTGTNTSPTNTVDKFTYTSGTAPTVTGVSPAGGPETGGTVVTITGTNFVTGASATFGGTAATNVTVVNSTTLKATSPATTTAGKVDVLVTTTGGTSTATTADLFNYRAGPTVTGVSPASGPTAGGTVVTITGTGFTNAATVTFGGLAATPVTFVNATTLKVPSPSTTTAGKVDVQVTTTSTSPANAADLFNYRAEPTVTGVSPASGTTAGGTAVTITGTGFTTTSTVYFGSTSNPAPTVTFVNSTTLKVISPPGAAGTIDITVKTVGGTSATSKLDQYTYL